VFSSNIKDLHFVQWRDITIFVIRRSSEIQFALFLPAKGFSEFLIINSLQRVLKNLFSGGSV
jgi:hypothetical protein